MPANPKSKDSIAYLGPATSGVAVTPSDTRLQPTKGLTCAVTGTAAVRFEGDTADVTVTLNSGVFYPYTVVFVRSSGTTATGIVALY